MIGKGKSRGNGKQLADYLLRDPKNEQAELIETRGFEEGSLAQQLTGAEALALAETRGRLPFYFAAFRTKDGERLTPEQWIATVDEAERELGYQGLDRAIVRHVKDGEEHYHAVWNRHDKDTNTLRSDSNNGRKLRAAMDRIEDRFGLRQLGRDDEKNANAPTDDEIRQAARSVKNKAERVAEITALWQATDSGKAFRAALEDAGYTVATGKSRAFCVVDGNGEIHSLARQIDGAKAKDVAARFADIDPATVPEADGIRRVILEAKREREGEQSKAGPAKGPAAEELDDPAADYSAPELPPVPTAPREADDARPRPTAEAILTDLTRHNSTFTRNELERAVAKATGHEGREAWMTQEGGYDALAPDMRQQAAASYEKWAEANPRAAARYSVADYVSYAQDREAERQAETDPEAAKARAVTRAAFRSALSEIDSTGGVVGVGPDKRGRERFTTQAMLETELRLEAAGATLVERAAHGVKAETREIAQTHVEAARGFALSDEQAAALAHVTQAGDLALVVGYAGAGKSTMLDAARAAWEAQGFRVQGTALSGIAAQGLEDSAGIKSRNLHQLLHRLDTQDERGEALAALDGRIADIKGRSAKANKFRADLTRQRADMAADVAAGRLSARDIIVVDEAAMIGARQMERLLDAAQQAGAKVVMVGDHEQLQSIEAGAGFRALMERHGAAQITTIMRQREDWQREATQAFPTGAARTALDAYQAHGMTHETETRDQAKAALVEAWAAARQEKPGATQIILAHTRADVGDLNKIARDAYRAEGRLGEDHELQLRDGSLTLAEGDRLLFGKNDGRLGVKNGTLGRVESIAGERITVAVDGAAGRRVTFDIGEYQAVSHGYAATVHKTQGATVDRAYVLATGGMDRNMAYVAMSRHRDQADLFHAREDFASHGAMTARLSRDGAKDAVLDYLARAAEPAAPAMPGGFRAALAGAWQRVKDAFGRKGDHPAEAEAKAKDQQKSERVAAQAAAEAARQAAERARAEEAERQRRAALTPSQRMLEDMRQRGSGTAPKKPTEAEELLAKMRAAQTDEARQAADRLRAERTAQAAKQLADALKKGRKPGSYDDGPDM